MSKTAEADAKAHMMPLAEPEGWFLLKAEHQHSSPAYQSDPHRPLPHAAGPWLVVFQCYPTGGRATEGRGRSLHEAWRAAYLAVLNAS